MARVRSNLPASTSATRPARALTAARSEPSKARETWTGRPEVGSAPAKALSCHWPDPGGRSRMVPARLDPRGALSVMGVW